MFKDETKEITIRMCDCNIIYSMKIIPEEASDLMNIGKLIEHNLTHVVVTGMNHHLYLLG